MTGGRKRLRRLLILTLKPQKMGGMSLGLKIPHSRGFPKIMRGNNTYIGNAAMFWHFANEFFPAVGL